MAAVGLSKIRKQMKQNQLCHEIASRRSPTTVAMVVLTRLKEMQMKIVNKVRKIVRDALRARVVAAFAKIASAVNVGTAHRRTMDFYRSSGAAWTRSLS